MRELLFLTAPRRAIYSEAHAGWCDDKGKEVVGPRLLTLLESALSRCGLRGIGSTLGFMASAQLHRFVQVGASQQGPRLGSRTAVLLSQPPSIPMQVYHSLMQGELLASFDWLHAALHPMSKLPDKPKKLCEAATSGARSLPSFSSEL